MLDTLQSLGEPIVGLGDFSLPLFFALGEAAGFPWRPHHPRARSVQFTPMLRVPSLWRIVDAFNAVLHVDQLRLLAVFLVPVVHLSTEHVDARRRTLDPQVLRHGSYYWF